MTSKNSKLIANFTALLTIISMLPYDYGQVADIFPPEWKKWVTLSAAVATYILRNMGHAVTPAAAANTTLVVNTTPPATQPPSAANPQIINP